VSARIEATIRTNQRASAKGDGAGVDEGGVEVEEDTGAEADIAAVVNVDGAVYPGIGGEE
jgi:hypothetical protein